MPTKVDKKYGCSAGAYYLFGKFLGQLFTSCLKKAICIEKYED